MVRKLFGTDGIRGRVNEPPMTVELALKVGRAVTHLLKEDKKLNRRPKIVLGKDTRLSGYMLETALASGISSQGADVYLAGPIPTPGLAFLTSSLRADAGLVISASHNPYQDNGIKIFNRDGYKFPDEKEALLEEYLDDKILDKFRPKADGVGKAFRINDAVGRYVVFLKYTFPKHFTLEGLKIVLDCANGAAYKSAPAVFEELGAQVYVIGDKPDGTNINRGVGSLHPEVCAQKVLEMKADLGLALDGDADRVIFIDKKGRIVDGDQIMGICAASMKKHGRLKKNTIAATVMSNMGLELYLEKQGINLVRTKVGDRYVVECLRQNDFNFGGEQSGHLIFLDHGTTGDGTLAALQTIAVMLEEERDLDELTQGLELLPQTLINVPALKSKEALNDPKLKKQVEKIEKILGRKGRILLRPSGTEPVVRIMIEGEDMTLIQKLAQETASLAAKTLN